MPKTRSDLQALLEIYKINREELQGFRTTVFHVYGIVVTLTGALLAAILQWNPQVLALIVPVPLALLFLSGVAYVGWRMELIEVAANLEREIVKITSLPDDCCYEQIFVKKHKHGLPAGMERRSMQLAAVTTVISLVLYYWIFMPMILSMLPRV